jgi:hypothetical protein
MKRDDENGIDERSFRFFRDVLAFVETIPVEPKTKKIIRYNEISPRGANESVRWLRACAAGRFGAQQQCLALLDEGRQLARILGKIVVTTKRRVGLLPAPTPKPLPFALCLCPLTFDGVYGGSSTHGDQRG